MNHCHNHLNSLLLLIRVSSHHLLAFTPPHHNSLPENTTQHGHSSQCPASDIPQPGHSSLLHGQCPAAKDTPQPGHLSLLHGQCPAANDTQRPGHESVYSSFDDVSPPERRTARAEIHSAAAANSDSLAAEILAELAVEGRTPPQSGHIAISLRKDFRLKRHTFYKLAKNGRNFPFFNKNLYSFLLYSVL